MTLNLVDIEEKHIGKHNNKLYLTDLDGSLVKGSLMLKHAGYLIENGIIEDNGSYSAWVEDQKNEELIVALAAHYAIGIRGLTLSQLKVDKFIVDQIADDKNLYDTFNYLVNEQENGNTVYVISGSPDFLVKRLATLYGFNWVASQYMIADSCYTGKVRGMYSREQKSRWILDHLDTSLFDKIIAIGDTSSDDGLFEYADFNLLVEPNQYTINHVQNKIDYIVREF